MRVEDADFGLSHRGVSAATTGRGGGRVHQGSLKAFSGRRVLALLAGCPRSLQPVASAVRIKRRTPN
jgi:hypothetical protein